MPCELNAARWVWPTILLLLALPFLAAVAETADVADNAETNDAANGNSKHKFAGQYPR